MSILAVGLLWTTCATPQAAHQETYEALGRTLIEVAEKEGPAPLADDARLPAERRLLYRLATTHDVVELGLVDLWLPHRGLDSDGAPTDLRREKVWPTLAQYAVTLQQRWFEVLEPTDEASAARMRKALDTLGRWAKRARARTSPPAGEAHLDAARMVRAQWSPADFRWVIAVAPTRAQYVGLIGAAGVYIPGIRRQSWTSGSLRAANTYFLPSALAFSLVGGPLDDDDPPLRERELAGESVRCYGAHAIAHQLSNLLVPTAPLWFGEGLALYDTVAVAGEDETLCSGYSGRKATSVDDLSASVGNALIYARIERSPFRTGGCKDHFVDELRAARVEGGFRVLDLDTSREGVVLAGPFLGERAVTPDPVRSGPRGLKEGYAEFLRAYCCAFVAFLDAQEAGDATLLEATLRDLHQRRREPEDTRSRLSSVLHERTGKTLGESMDPERDLEGAFAAWLATRR